MGWLVLLAIKPVLAALDAWTFGWLLAGGVAYTLGTVFYHRPSMRYSHAIWHLFVVAGSVCHYIAVMAQVLRAERRDDSPSLNRAPTRSPSFHGGAGMVVAMARGAAQLIHGWTRSSDTPGGPRWACSRSRSCCC